jgi:hypothetical protein
MFKPENFFCVNCHKYGNQCSCCRKSDCSVLLCSCSRDCGKLEKCDCNIWRVLCKSHDLRQFKMLNDVLSPFPSWRKVCNVCDYYPCQCEQIKVIKAEQEKEEKRRKRKERKIKRAKKMAVPVLVVPSAEPVSELSEQTPSDDRMPVMPSFPVYGVSSQQTLSIKRKTVDDPICVASSEPKKAKKMKEPAFPTDRFPNKLKDSFVATREFIIGTESSKKKCKL